MSVTFLDLVSLCKNDYQTVLDIFYETSGKKNFSSNEEKSNFEFKYFRYYLEKEPRLCFCVKLDERIIGYIIGSSDTLRDKELFNHSPYLELFKEFYVDFPAHLHLNLTSSTRGKGVGVLLINEFISRILPIAGVHIITGSRERNIHFYQKCGFNYMEYSNDETKSLIFMGKKL